MASRRWNSQIARIFLVDFLEFIGRGIRTGNIEMPILHKVVVRVAATRLAPARKLSAALDDQGCPLVLRYCLSFGIF